MTEESVAVRLERYRNAWCDAPGVVDSTGGFPDSERMESVWAWSDHVAQACLRNPGLLADLHAAGLLDRCYADGEMSASLVKRLEGVDDETALESGLRRFRRREMVRII